ncbi:type IV secretion system protein TraC [Vibrio aestuarianus subsp. cardii]|uniref:type IV secretion system protein TraC n=1 Tax=Vibrio aestuarianus TaxID=28171 RepID=UPI001559CD58|nr:type IV secretion system protein TraC [Vibrio aestuarianus]NGZ66618.1 type IV secretion system protein TraC [Vibrio aestuarianus subsp. cardii]
MFKFLFKENEASRLFRPLAYDQDSNLFICDDKMVAFSFVCQPAAGWDMQLLSTIQLMLSQDAYPVNSLMSFTLFASPDVRSQLLASDQMRHKCRNALMRESHDAALGFMWSGTQKPIEVVQGTQVRNFQLIVTLKMPIASIDITSDDVEKAVSLQRTMEQRLEKAYLSPVKMDSAMLVNIMHTMLHWQPDAEWRNTKALPVETDRTLNEQFLQYDTNVRKQRHGVKLGTDDKPTFVRMLTAQRFPRKARAGQAFKWFGDPFDGLGCVTQNFMITVNIQFPNNSAVKSKLETKKNHYIKQSHSALTLFAPKIKDMKADLEVMMNALGGEARAVRLSLSAAVFGSTEQEAEDGVTALQSFMKQSEMTMVNEDSFAMPSFIQLLPFGACNDAVKMSRRYFTLPSNVILPVLPIFAEWKGTGTPMLQFISRTGQIMNIDLYDSKTNFNTLIYAESGSGKSFLTNEIIRSYLSTGNKVWAIDAGESYKKLSSSFDGTFTAFNEDNELSCNPFTMIDDTDPNAFVDALEMLAGCLIAMAFTKSSPSDLQAAEMERILTEVWKEKGQAALIDDVKAKCLADDDLRVRDMGKQLTAFTTDGQFGKYFNKPHNVQFNGNFNVLELDGLSDTPRLQAVVLFMLMVQISDSMYREFKQDRGVKRLVIIDEAWDLLGNSKAVEQFMEKGFRRFRKYGGAGIIVTQSIMDLQKSAAGKAIAENAANSLILRQKTATITHAEKEDLMSLPQAGYRLLKKVTTEAGHYSEIFFNTNAGMGIGRLIVDPMRVLMYSTRAQDNEKIDAYMKQGMMLSDAMKQVVKDGRMDRLNMTKPEFITNVISHVEARMDADILEMPMQPIVEVKSVKEIASLKVVND